MSLLLNYSFNGIHSLSGFLVFIEHLLGTKTNQPWGDIPLRLPRPNGNLLWLQVQGWRAEQDGAQGQGGDTEQGRTEERCDRYGGRRKTDQGRSPDREETGGMRPGDWRGVGWGGVGEGEGRRQEQGVRARLGEEAVRGRELGAGWAVGESLQFRFGTGNPEQEVMRLHPDRGLRNLWVTAAPVTM